MDMQKIGKIIFVLSIVINIVLIFFLCTNSIPNIKMHKDKIDSLEQELSEYKNSRDSIQEVIDTIFVQLDDVNTEYEAIYDTILANSVSEDYIFFTEYLKWYFTGFFSNNNADTIEAN